MSIFIGIILCVVFATLAWEMIQPVTRDVYHPVSGAGKHFKAVTPQNRTMAKWTAFLAVASLAPLAGAPWWSLIAVLVLATPLFLIEDDTERRLDEAVDEWMAEEDTRVAEVERAERAELQARQEAEEQARRANPRMVQDEADTALDNLLRKATGGDTL